MGTMKSNFAGGSAIVILMLSTSRSLPLDGNENSFERNSLPDALTLDPRSASSSIYECLFVDPDLPICDVKWMLDSEEDPPGQGNSFGGDASSRSRRNVDVPAIGVVVYTIEGCLPPRLPFSMPSCDGIPLDRIVDVQRFRPFAVDRATKPPLVFPRFNYAEWMRAITRLRKHVSSKTREQAPPGIPEHPMHRSIHEESLLSAPPMEFELDGDSKKSLRRNGNEVEENSLSPDMPPDIFRRTRETRSSVSSRPVPEAASPPGIADESSKLDERATGEAVNRVTWRKRMPKERTSRKKYGGRAASRPSRTH